MAHVPVRQKVMPVGVGMGSENDHLIQDPHRFCVGLGIDPVHELHELLRAQQLRSVQAPIDPHHRLAFRSEGAGLRVRHPFGRGQRAGDLFVAVQVPVVLRRGDDRHQLRTPFLGHPDRVQHHAVRLGRQLLPVGHELPIRGQEIVRPQRLAELGLRRRDPGAHLVHRLRRYGGWHSDPS